MAARLLPAVKVCPVNLKKTFVSDLSVMKNKGLSSKEAWLELLYMWHMIRGCWEVAHKVLKPLKSSSSTASSYPGVDKLRRLGGVQTVMSALSVAPTRACEYTVEGWKYVKNLVK